MANFACKRCGRKAFSTSKARDDHAATCQAHPRFICGGCEYRTASKCNFRRHLARIFHQRHPMSADPDTPKHGSSPRRRASLLSCPTMLERRPIKHSPMLAKTSPFPTGKTPSAKKSKRSRIPTAAGSTEGVDRAYSMLSSHQEPELPSTSRKSHLDSEPVAGMELGVLYGALLSQSVPTSSQSFSPVISQVLSYPEALEYPACGLVKDEPSDGLAESTSSSPYTTSGASTTPTQSVPPPRIHQPTASTGSIPDRAAVNPMANPTVDELRSMMWDICRQFRIQEEQNNTTTAGSSVDKKADGINVSKDTDRPGTCTSTSRTDSESSRTDTYSNTVCPESPAANGDPNKCKDPVVSGESKQQKTIDRDASLTPEDEFLYGVGSLDEIRTSVERRPDGSWEWVTTVYRTWSKRARRLFPQAAGQRVLMSQTRRPAMTSCIDKDPVQILRCIDEEYLGPSAFHGDA